MVQVQNRLVVIGIMSVALLAATIVTADMASGSVDVIEDVRSDWQLAHPDSEFDARVEYQRHFRSQFDFLDASDATIAAVMTGIPTNESLHRWGLEMSDAEYAEMDRRHQIQKELPAIAAAAVGPDWSEELVEGLAPERSFGAFAGRWIDQQNGGRLVVALVPSHPDYAVSIQRASDTRNTIVGEGRLASDDVRFVDVAFTADQIYQVNSDFGALYLTDDSARRDVGMSASMNPVENRVDLYFESDWTVQAQRFARGYPSGLVKLVPVADDALQGIDAVLPASDWGEGEWHSGAWVEIRDGNDSVIGTCLWGATARTTSRVYLVTAAHCAGYSFNNVNQQSWFNSSVSNAVKRGVQTYLGDDVISNQYASTFVLIYHGVRGDLARLEISPASNAGDYDCMIESSQTCGQHIVRRELTTETEIGDTKCITMKTRGYVCGTLNSNDVQLSGYDWLRSINTGSSNHAQGGDSGGGIYEATLMTGILKGHFGWPTYDTYFTHAYYIETSGYLAATKVCGTTTICNN